MEMLVARLFKISKFKRNIFFSKTKILLISSNSVIINQAFLCSVNENPVTVNGFKTPCVLDCYGNYLRNDPKYRNLFFREEAKTNSKIADLLNQLELNKDDKSNVMDQLYYYLKRELNLLTFNELCEATFLIMKFIKHNGIDPSWENILESINEQCLIRMSSWKGDEIIKMTDISLMNNKLLRFKNKLFYKLMKHSSTSQEIVCLFYFLIKRRLEVPKEYKFNLQKRTLKILPEINFTEAGIIAEGYYRCFDRLQVPDLFCNFLKKFRDEEDTVDKIPFDSFCRFTKIMSNMHKSEEVLEFQKHAIQAALSFGTESVISLALCSENIKRLDSNLKAVLMKEVKCNIRQLSFLQIERVTNLNVLFNIHDEEFLKLALDVFETKEITEKNRKTFILFLSHLIHYKIYPKHLLAIVMEQILVGNIRGKGKAFINAWWYMYCSLEIEQPDCITVNLTPKVRKKIYNIYKFMNDNTLFKGMFWRIKTKLQDHFGEEMVTPFVPLPHYSKGLLMIFDKNSKPQMLPEDFITLNTTHPVRPLKDDNIWMFISCVSDFYIENATDFVPNLIFQTQVRQLNAIGYTVLPVTKGQFKSNTINHGRFEDELENLINVKLEECYKDQKGANTN